MTAPHPDTERIDALEKIAVRIAALEMALGTLITWTAQSAAAPISRGEAVRLLGMICPHPAASTRGEE